MKKILSLVLSLAIVLSAFCGLFSFEASAGTSYNYLKILDFDKLTTEKLNTIVTKSTRSGSLANCPDATVEIVEDNGQKAFKMTFTPRNASDWTEHWMDLEIPNSENLIGIKAHYKGENLYDGRFQILDKNAGKWVTPGFFEDRSSDFTLHEETTQEILFANMNRTVKGIENLKLCFQIDTGGCDATQDLSLIIYSLEFIYEGEIPEEDIPKVEYNYLKILDFDKLTTEKLNTIVTKSTRKSNLPDATIEIVEDNGQKAFKMSCSPSVWTEYWMDLDIPDSANCIGIRAHYRGDNLYDGRFQLYDDGAWVTPGFFEDRTSDFTLHEETTQEILFANMDRTVKGKSVKLAFQLDKDYRDETKDLALIIYSLEFIYEGDIPEEDMPEEIPDPDREYRHSKIVDFDNLTSEQATQLFTKHDGEDSTVEIIEDQGQKALKLTFNPTYDGNHTRYKMSLPVPKDDQLAGMRVHFKGENLHGGRLQIFYNGGWKTTDFLTNDVHSADNLIGEVDKEIIFTDKGSAVAEGRNNELHFLLRGYSSVAATTSITVYDIEFLYKNTFDGYTKTIEDFEVMPEEDAASFMMLGGKNDAEDAAFTYSITTNGGYAKSNGLLLSKTAGGKINHKGSKIDLSDSNIIGMRVCYTVPEKISSMQLRILDQGPGAWTDVDFANGGSAVEIGTYDKVVLFEGKSINRNSSYLCLRFDLTDNKSIIIDEIQFIYSGTAPAGDPALLNTLINTTCKKFYDGGNTGGWNETSWGNFVRYYDKAQELLAKETYTQPEVDDAYRHLDRAFSILSEEFVFYANFVDTFGISGKTDIYKSEGGKDTAVAFPDASLEAADDEAPYDFLGWSKSEGGATVESDTYADVEQTYYATWRPNLVVIKKVLLKAMETPESVINDMNGDTEVDVRDLIWLKEYETLPTLEGESLKKYVEELVDSKHKLTYNEDGSFRVLINADAHMWVNRGDASDQTNINRYKENLKMLVEKEKPNLVIFTGDNTYMSNVDEEITRKNLDILVGYLEEQKIPWCHVYGNHDDEGNGVLSKEAQQEIYESYEYCISKSGPNNLFGVGNYAHAVYNADGTIGSVIYLLDSGNLAEDGGYDYIKDNQIAWYKETSELLQRYNGGKVVPSIMAFHIPMYENQLAYENRYNKDIVYEWDGGFGDRHPYASNKDYSNLFETIQERGDIKAVITGHDHRNDYMLNYYGVKLCASPNFGGMGYYTEEIQGARILDLNVATMDDIPTYISRVNEPSYDTLSDNVALQFTDEAIENTKVTLYNDVNNILDASFGLESGKGVNGGDAIKVACNGTQNAQFILDLENKGKVGNNKYLAVWADFTNVEFRKACFGFKTPYGICNTDEVDSYPTPFYYLPDGATSINAIEEMSHGNDGCFGDAQSSGIAGKKGYFFFPVEYFETNKYFGNENGASHITEDSAITALYFYFSMSKNGSYENQPFYFDDMRLLVDIEDIFQ